MLTQPDFSLDKIKVLHIEATTTCQAACPQCAREDSRFYNHYRDKADLSLHELQQKFDKDFIKNLDKVMFCGNYGDPCANPDLFAMLQFFRSINPDITLGINTNGALKSAQWWIDLAHLMTGKNDYVVFAIDGLADTNHIYRQRVVWHKLMTNAKAFISAGGPAHWDMLVFEHNEHQVADCERLARDMGFRWFRTKITNRFEFRPVAFINPPKNLAQSKNHFHGNITCNAQQEQSIYLCATGELMPCCFMGVHVFNRDNDIDRALRSKNFKAVVDSWQTVPLKICRQNCSHDHSGSHFSRQFKKAIQLA